MAEGVRFELTCPKDKRFSRPPRYDRFDNPPCDATCSGGIVSYFVAIVKRICHISAAVERVKHPSGNLGFGEEC